MSDNQETPFQTSNYQEALRRIDEAERNGWTWLNLGDLCLDELPPELGHLKQLQRLAWGTRFFDANDDHRLRLRDGTFRSPKFTNLNPLANLAQLAALDISGCEAVTDLGPLAYLTQLTTLDISGCEAVTDLGPLANLTQLTTLDMSWCKAVTDLGPLANLTQLTTLDSSWCEAVTDLGPLANLTQLTTLKIRECKAVTDLGPLANLTQLTTLDISSCKAVKDLGPLANLTQLTTLDIAGCEAVTDLGPLANLAQLTTLNIFWCEAVTDLEPLANLTQLTTLDISWRKAATDLGPLANLAQLTTLKIRECEALTDLELLANLTQLTTLDIWRCESLTDLGSLANLTQLTTLNISWCEAVTDLGPLANLTQLTTLDISLCKAVTDLGPLANLTQLTTLDISSCKAATNLGPLANLTQLTTLDIAGCKAVTDLGPLANLTQLTTLKIAGCEAVTDLGPLANLTQLTTLYIPECEAVTNLGPLANLTQLTTLDISSCKAVTDLEPLLSLSALEILFVDHTGVPLPDDLRGSEDACNVLDWVRNKRDETVGWPLAEIKVLLVGQGRVGKSHIRQRLFKSNNIMYYNTNEKYTDHIDCTECILAETDILLPDITEVKLRVWDFGGQNELHSSHRFFLGSQRCFYILVLAADRPANGEGDQSNRLNYWLRLIAEYGRSNDEKRAPVLIVITRNDVATDAQRAQVEEALRAAETHRPDAWFGAKVVGEVIGGVGWSAGLNETFDKAIWARHQDAINQIRTAILAHLHEVPELTTPFLAIYHEAKQFVEAAFSTGERTGEEGRPWLAVDDERFANRHANRPGGETDEPRRVLQPDCLRRLHSLGVVHWAEWAEAQSVRTIVFNPEWVRPPVYKLIRRENPEPPRGWLLSDERLRQLLRTRPGPSSLPESAGPGERLTLYERLPFRNEDRGRILDLMKACNLVFSNRHWIIVPDRLPSAALSEQDAPAGSWKYMVDFLPEKVFLRFIAEKYEDIERDAERFFRNRLDWRESGEEVRLEAHYSPPGDMKPYILIYPASPGRDGGERAAAAAQAVLDTIFRQEGFRGIKSELVRVGVPEQPPGTPPISQGLKGLARFGPAYRTVTQLRCFQQIGIACHDREEQAFTIPEMLEITGVSRPTLPNYLDDVVELFRRYFAKYGHPGGFPKGRGPFGSAALRPEGAPDEEDRILAVEDRSGWRICEPVGRWAWELTHAFMTFLDGNLEIK